MKKRRGLLVIIVMLIGFMAYHSGVFSEKIAYMKDDHAKLENVKSIDITKDAIYQGDLLLVNRDYPIQPESVKKDVISLIEHPEIVQGYGLLDTNILLSQEIAENFSDVVQAAETDGIHHFMINSGYRDFEEQQALYARKGSSYALPAGYSEHNIGVSLDVGSTQGKMETASEGKWLRENAWKYGFILRYPEDKTAITNIQYEPWHIRYVGMPHSAIMHDQGFVLEEYIDYLRAEGRVSVRLYGIQYTIQYYPVTEPMEMKVTVNHDYQISGNNVDGVIVTIAQKD